MEKKDEEEEVCWNLEDDSLGHLVDYGGKESSGFLRAKPCSMKTSTSTFENLVQL